MKFPKSETLSHKLSWSHYFEIQKNDHVLVEYALAGISNQLFVSKYMLYLPDKEKLIKELNKILENPNG